jgi:hypothetical protein
MRELRREIDINAPRSAVWAVLTNFRSYPEWNPFIRSVSGDLRQSARLDVRIEPPGARAMSFKPTVLNVEDERELRWLGRFLVRGLFDGEHIFRLEALGDDGTRFTQAERFSGMLIRAFGSTIDKTELGFEQMNAALKARAEAH